MKQCLHGKIAVSKVGNVSVWVFLSLSCCGNWLKSFVVDRNSWKIPSSLSKVPRALISTRELSVCSTTTTTTTT